MREFHFITIVQSAATTGFSAYLSINGRGLTSLTSIHRSMSTNKARATDLPLEINTPVATVRFH
jgi:hypothetical protein